MSYNLNNLFPKPSIYLSTPVADQRLTVDDTVGGVQFSAFSQSTDLVMFDIQTADVMCTIDGSAPTSSNGHRLANGTSYTWSKAMASAAKFIRLTGSNGVIHASELQM